MSNNHSLFQKHNFVLVPTLLAAPEWEYLRIFMLDLLPYLVLGGTLIAGLILFYTGAVRMHRSSVGRIIATYGGVLLLSAGGLGVTLLPALSSETALLTHDVFLLAGAAIAIRALFLLKKIGCYGR